MVNGYGQATVLAVSIFLQLGAAVIALLMIKRSGVHLPWVLIAIAITLMMIRRIISFANLLSTDLTAMYPVLPELVALVISILMLTGLVLFRPAFVAIRERENAAQVRAQEQTLLARESHHHVKNDLQLLQSLVSLQEGYEGDSGRGLFLRDLSTRIQTIGLLHEQLYDVADADSFAHYAAELVRSIQSSYAVSIPDIRVHTDLAEIELGRNQIVHSGLILAEALTNSFKYAFDGIAEPAIWVTTTEGPAGRTLEIRDNGRGMVGQPASNSFGTLLMEGIAEAEGWRFTRRSNGGVTVLVEFDPGSEGRAQPATA